MQKYSLKIAVGGRVVKRIGCGKTLPMLNKAAGLERMAGRLALKKHFGGFSNRVKSTVAKSFPITQVKETSTMPLFTRKMLGDAGIEISMAKICLENPYAERVYAPVKNDYPAAYNINTPSGLKKRHCQKP